MEKNADFYDFAGKLVKGVTLIELMQQQVCIKTKKTKTFKILCIRIKVKKLRKPNLGKNHLYFSKKKFFNIQHLLTELSADFNKLVYKYHAGNLTEQDKVILDTTLSKVSLINQQLTLEMCLKAI
jgi:hypothetical protein